MKEIIQAVFGLLKQGEDIVLATIISHEGSTPRTSGSKMIIRKKDSPIGTIGGGLLEAEVLQEAVELFNTRKSLTRAFDMTQTDVSSTDMICGGQLDVLIEYVGNTPENIDLYQKILEVIENRQKCTLVTGVSNLTEMPLQPHRFLIMEDGRPYGVFSHPQATLDRMNQALETTPTAFLLTIYENIFFLEPFQELGVLMVFGAGHVSQPTAVYGTHLGFRVIVLDDRIEFANRDRFPESVEIKVLPDFNDCMEGFTIDENYYLVIVTRGHLHDKIVLAQALKTRAGYIGMIGSQKKRDNIYKALLKEGFTEKDLKRVHSPIGLDIGAQTPQEIAISITAELIQERARKNI